MLRGPISLLDVIPSVSPRRIAQTPDSAKNAFIAPHLAANRIPGNDH